MMKYPAILLFGLLVCFPAEAQLPGEVYWIGFTDKAGSAFSIDQPEGFLSPEALERRQRQGIPVDSTDLPVNQGYIDSLTHMGFRPICRSRWLNAALFSCPDPSLPGLLTGTGFVREIRKARSIVNKKSFAGKWEEQKTSLPGDILPGTYGYSDVQIRQLRGEYLHGSGYRGQGIRIGVIDGGFTGADSDDLFAPVDIRKSRNFLDPENDVYRRSSHGTRVLSIMATNLTGTLVGTAPEASYWLFLTEDVLAEYPAEMDLWIAAAEYADSIGLDVLNTSLGYSTFDDPAFNYLPADLDGYRIRISRAATLAASKGMVLINSAGNAGNKGWGYITAPADAGPVLAVGAVDEAGTRADFSSHGPTADGRVKPDVMAMGKGTVQYSPDAGINAANGTSFSSPVIAGLAACLWQAHPEASAQEIIDAIRESADRYLAPDSLYGYGIPDFELAHLLLSGSAETDPEKAMEVLVYPNPFRDELRVRIYNEEGKLSKQTGTTRILLYNSNGEPVWNAEVPESGPAADILRIPLPPGLDQGIYILVVQTAKGNYHTKITKIKNLP